MLTSVSYTASVGEYASGGTGGDFHCGIAAIASGTAFRPPRITPKPIVQGPQTAIVVGKAGEEIYTDDEGLGRVKVQFHWDRYSQTDENSSCCARRPADRGSSWGFLGLPRVGHEVVVEFLEGDPDHPIVTGSVYNDVLKPPYALPTEKTRTGFKSHSSTGGSSSNFNELRFEDKIGEEDIYIHAEKDKTTRVKNDQVKWIGNEDHLIIKQDVFEKREADHHITLTGDRNEKLESGTLSLEVASAISWVRSRTSWPTTSAPRSTSNPATRSSSRAAPRSHSWSAPAISLGAGKGHDRRHGDRDQGRRHDRDRCRDDQGQLRRVGWLGGVRLRINAERTRSAEGGRRVRGGRHAGAADQGAAGAGTARRRRCS